MIRLSVGVGAHHSLKIPTTRPTMTIYHFFLDPRTPKGDWWMVGMTEEGCLNMTREASRLYTSPMSVGGVMGGALGSYTLPTYTGRGRGTG